jgi:hypothetical protein
MVTDRLELQGRYPDLDDDLAGVAAGRSLDGQRRQMGWRAERRLDGIG